MTALRSQRNQVIRDPLMRDRTISLPVAGAYLPGTFVTASTTALTQATAGTGRLFLLGCRDYIGQDIVTAYTSGDTGIAYRLRPDTDICAAVAAATYTKGQELTVGASGRLAAAASGNVVVAFFDDDEKSGVAQSAGTICDAVVANSYVKA